MNNRIFPKNGTFAEQKEYVSSLTLAEKSDDRHIAIQVVKNSKNVFHIDKDKIPPTVKIKVFHHALSNTTEINNDEPDSDNEGENINAVVTREINIDKNNTNETIILRVPGQDENSESLFKLTFGENGTFKKAKHYKQKLSDFKTGLTQFANNENKKAEGVVVEAELPNQNKVGLMYSSFTR